MRWLPQISFSSSSSSSSLKPMASSPDRNLDRDRFHRRFFRFNRGRGLTRQRKLRHLTDDDVASTSGLNRSPSAYTRSPSAVPLPLPLPSPEVPGDPPRNRNAVNNGAKGSEEDRAVPDRTTSAPPLTWYFASFSI